MINLYGAAKCMMKWNGRRKKEGKKKERKRGNRDKGGGRMERRKEVGGKHQREDRDGKK